VDLAFDDAAVPPRLERASGVDALAVVVPNTVRFALDDDDRNRREMITLTELSASVPTYRLRRKRGFDVLEACVARLALLSAAEYDAQQ
jgi:hypothetical protein